MNNTNKKTKNSLDVQEFRQNFRLKGIMTPKRDIQKDLNIFEQLGFTSSINSVIKDLEQNGNIQILSPFSQTQEPNTIPSSMNFGTISTHNLNKIGLDPASRRIKFINGFLIKFLLLAIIINFILIFTLWAF